MTETTIASASEMDVGRSMHDLVVDLYPICRSITGDGARQTLARINEIILLEIHEIPTGTPVLDWTVPKEWNIRDAFVKNANGDRVIDFQASNLHVVNYSVPVQRSMTWQDLRPHLHSDPEHPDWIPYRTSYYVEAWGFCLSHNRLLELERATADDEVFEVCIDTSLTEGSLTYGECVLPGVTDAEVLISTHICHPSLCNDNLSGMALATYLAKSLRSRPHRYSYRFLFIPGTIGSIAWLARNESGLDRIHHGLVVACVGDAGPFTYKRSRRGDAEIDRVVAYVLEQRGSSSSIRDFVPYGYDERQYCSPGFNLPVGCLSRTPHGEFPEYHTSADNLDFIDRQALAGSMDVCRQIVEMLEANRSFVGLATKGEPQLGRRGLYRAMGGFADPAERQMAMLWLLNLADGQHTLLDVARKSDLPFQSIRETADVLAAHELIRFRS